MSTKLFALQDIPGTVQIVSGQIFHEVDPERAEYWVRTGMAKRDLTAVVAVADEPPRLNARGWDRLHWDKASVVIIASGPSLTEEQCVIAHKWRNASKHRRAIVVNTSFKMASWADILYACDGRWWDHYFEEVSKLMAREAMWTQDIKAAKTHRINHIMSQRSRGLSKKPGVINQGMNGGFQAMNIAYLAGAKEMFLLGFDCKGGHWHGEHPAGLNARLPHKQWVDAFMPLAVDLKAEGVSVINCSPDSALDCFEKKSVEILA